MPFDASAAAVDPRPVAGSPSAPLPLGAAMVAAAAARAAEAETHPAGTGNGTGEGLVPAVVPFYGVRYPRPVAAIAARRSRGAL